MVRSDSDVDELGFSEMGQTKSLGSETLGWPPMLETDPTLGTKVQGLY